MDKSCKGVGTWACRWDTDPSEIRRSATTCLFQICDTRKIKAWFKKCGILPFDHNAPDYSELEATAAQQEYPSTIYEGVDLDSRKFLCKPSPIFTFTEPPRWNPSWMSLQNAQRQESFKYGGSLCDMVLDYVSYGPLLHRYETVPFSKEEPQKEFIQTPPSSLNITPELEHEVHQSDPTCLPSRPSSSSRPQGTPKSSRIMTQCYTTDFTLKGGLKWPWPKIVKTMLDITFCLSSKRVIHQLQQWKESRESKPSKKRASLKSKNPGARRTTTGSRELLPPHSSELLPRHSSELFPLESPVQTPPANSDSSDAESVTHSKYLSISYQSVCMAIFRGAWIHILRVPNNDHACTLKSICLYCLLLHSVNLLLIKPSACLSNKA